MECEHTWKKIRDWYGDPDVPYGTADCSFLRCTKCGEEDHDLIPGSTFDNPDDYREDRDDDR